MFIVKHESDEGQNIRVTREVIEEPGHKTDVEWTCEPENRELKLELDQSDLEQKIHAPLAIIRASLENK